MHPSLVTSLDGTLHAAWLDNSLAAHAAVGYSHQSGGSWSAPSSSARRHARPQQHERRSGPSIATDPSNRPHVLYMDETSNGSDDYVRLRYRVNGSWVDNTPPGGAGGPSNPAGTLYAHTPQNYVSSAGDDFVFLGHDSVISPGGYQYQPGGPGSNWSPYTRLDPRDRSNTTGGAPGPTAQPRSASIRCATRIRGSSTSSTTTRATARRAMTTTGRCTTRRSSRVARDPRRDPAPTPTFTPHLHRVRLRPHLAHVHADGRRPGRFAGRGVHRRTRSTTTHGRDDRQQGQHLGAGVSPRPDRLECQHRSGLLVHGGHSSARRR